jgi:multiple sugar transport system substrate-binding protein
MHDKAKELFAAFKAGQMSRRELMSGAAKLGVSAATANFLMNAAATQALAADFDWKKFNGTKLHLLLNKHPYADAMIADLDNFKGLTGMDVTYDIFPEDVYFDKVTAALSSKSSQYDAFMTGAYMTWTYGRPQRVDQGSRQDQSEVRLGRRVAWLEGVHRMERRAGSRARIGRRQAMVHTVGLRAEFDRVQPQYVRQGRGEASEQSSGAH